MHVLVTRPEPDASRLAAELAAMGLEVSVDPLLGIEPCLPGGLSVAGIGGLVVTSRNALKAFSEHPSLPNARGLPLYVVGPATARLARDLGFSTVIEGAATARELAPVITARHDRALGPLLQLRGDHVAFDLGSALSEAGIELREVTAYRSMAATELRPETRQLLADGRLNLVLVMSPRTAEAWVRLVTAAGLDRAASRPRYVCMSEAVARPLAALGAVATAVPARPNSQEMLALVAGMAALSPPRPTRA